MPRNTLSQSQAKITSTHLDAPQSNTEHENETVSEDDTDSESDTNDTNVASSQAAKRLPAHLQQIKEAQHKKRRSHRLLGKEDKTSDTPLLSHRSSYGQSPHKKGLNRRDGHRKRKEEQLFNRQVTDSQLLQATHDPNGRKKREKPLDR